MKGKKIVFYGLMFLPLMGALAALWFLPEQIPGHYDSEIGRASCRERVFQRV